MVELGTVPLAPDGSFFVEVPADMGIAFQAVDADVPQAVVADMTNAPDTRHAAAAALGKIADPALAAKMKRMAADYPDFATRRVLAGQEQRLPIP